MKPETYVCIQGSPLIPKGSKATWSAEMNNYMLCLQGADGSYYVAEPRRLHRMQVEQNPECWQRESEIDLIKKNPRYNQVLEENGMKNAMDEFVKKGREKIAEQKRQESIPKKEITHWEYHVSDTMFNNNIGTFKTYKEALEFAQSYYEEHFASDPLQACADPLRITKNTYFKFQIPNQE